MGDDELRGSVEASGRALLAMRYRLRAARIDLEGLDALDLVTLSTESLLRNTPRLEDAYSALYGLLQGLREVEEKRRESAGKERKA